jgi:hypothetical protein
MRLVLTDETGTGTEVARQLLDDVPATVTLRELIWFRVREEALRHRLAAPANPLVRGHRLSWQAQADRAWAAFEHNGFFVFVDGVQVDDLDVELAVGDSSTVAFVRLTPALAS